MRFSVGIPVWNQQEFLPDAVESVLDQTCKDYELLICNDGSPDHSSEIAHKYAEKYPIKVIDQCNKGLASARNTLIMNSVGDYFLPLDSDDILLPDCLEKMSDAVEQTQADCVAPSFKNFGIVNNEVKLHPQPTLEMFRDVGNMLPYFSAIKREALLECGGYSPRMQKGYEDLHLWFDLLLREKTLCVMQDILVLYRTKQNSMLTEAVKHHDELMQQIKKDFPLVWQK